MAKKKTKKISKPAVPTPEEQLELLRHRFGTDGGWVEVTLPLTYDEMNKYFGERCKDYEPLCGCCSGWMEWQKTGKATVTLERSEIVKLLDTI
jgi:hypothetical protein